MTITWNTEVNAPCCPGEILADDGRSVLVQTDWEYPKVASAFGWKLMDVQACKLCGTIIIDDGPGLTLACDDCDGGAFTRCDHDGTDGTVDCPCGLTATDFIGAARDWLDDHDGATADDPGYF